MSVGDLVRQYGLTALGLFVAVLVLVGVGAWFWPSRSGKTLAAERETSKRWARLRDVEDLCGGEGDPRRVRLGLLKGHALFAPPLRSAMVIAPTGAGKTPRVMVPNVLRHHGPALVASVKSDLLVLTEHGRKQQGRVWVFDPSGAGPVDSCRWSPLAKIATYGDALSASRWIAESSKEGSLGVQDVAFWEAHGRRCVAPMLFAAARSGEDMGTVARWAQTEDLLTVRNVLDEVGDQDAIDAWVGHSNLTEKTRSSVWATAYQILEAWGHPVVRGAVRVRPGDENVFDVDRFADSSDTLYLVAPAADQELFRPIFETLTQAVLQRVERLAARNAQPLSPPLLVALDEAANIAPLRNLDRWASKGAGEGVLLITVWQDEAQMEKIYGSALQRTIKSNHFAKIYLAGISDQDSLEALSRAIGSDEVRRTSVTHSRGGERSTSNSWQEITVAPPEWLRELKGDEAVALVGRYKPLRLQLPGWWEEPEVRAMIAPEVAASFDARFASSGPKKRRGWQREKKRPQALLGPSSNGTTSV